MDAAAAVRARPSSIRSWLARLIALPLCCRAERALRDPEGPTGTCHDRPPGRQPRDDDAPSSLGGDAPFGSHPFRPCAGTGRSSFERLGAQPSTAGGLPCGGLGGEWYGGRSGIIRLGLRREGAHPPWPAAATSRDGVAAASNAGCREEGGARRAGSERASSRSPLCAEFAKSLQRKHCFRFSRSS